MKRLTAVAILLIISIAFSACAVCPHPGGPVSEKRVQKHDKTKFRVHQRVKQLRDGYWYVSTQQGFMDPVALVFECKPDSQMLADMRRPGGVRPYLQYLRDKHDGL